MDIHEREIWRNPEYLLSCTLVRGWPDVTDRAVGRVVLALLNDCLQNCALPDIDPALMRYAPVAVSHFDYCTLGGALDWICARFEVQRKQRLHYGMRWAQAGGIGAPQFYLHRGRIEGCAMCRPPPDPMQPRHVTTLPYPFMLVYTLAPAYLLTLSLK